MSPQTSSRRYTYTHLKWFMGASVFSTFPLYDFSFFFFLRSHKKHKNAKKLISYYFRLRCFLSAFLIFILLFAFCAFAWLRFSVFCAFGAFWCFQCFLVLFGAFWCFFSAQNLSVKKKLKKFKTALITSFILPLKGAGLKSIKKTLQHRCLPVNTAKFLRTSFSTEHLRWLHLIKL